MGLNESEGLGRSKNVRIFGGAPENDEIIYGQGWRPRSEITKAWRIICKCVMVISETMEYFII